MTSKNDDDVLEVLMEVRDAMIASGQGPDMPELRNFTGNRDNWFDPRRPLATDVWRVLAGLPRKYGRTRSCAGCGGTKKILEDHDGRAGYRPCTECA
jgi:hypothetical protein